MGTILIGLKRHQAEIRQCHVNVWMLPSWPGELHFLDIGLWIKSTSSGEPINRFDLGIPARLKECDTSCLITQIGGRRTWQLVFPECTGVTDQPEGHWHRTITQSGQSLRMTGVAIEPVEEYADDFSLWRIKLRKPLPPDAETYIRVRFKVKGVFGGLFGATTISRDLLLYESVRSYDIRVNDVREQAVLDPILELFEDLAPISRVNAFLIVRPGYTPRILSPTRHIRLIEGTKWEGYLLRRLSALAGPPKVVIYSWRADWESPSTEEFRAFASFHRDLGRIHAPTVSIGITLSVLATALAQPDWVRDAVDSLVEFTEHYPVLTTALVIIPLLAYLLGRFVRPLANALDYLSYRTRVRG